MTELRNSFRTVESGLSQSRFIRVHAQAFDDYSGAFKDAGFEIEIYKETRNWRRLLADAISAVVASEDAIRREVEGPAAERLLRWARARPGELDHSRRVRFSVQRPV